MPLGCEKSVVLARDSSLAVVNVFKAASVHTSSFFCPTGAASRLLRGLNMAASWLRNQWYKLMSAKILPNVWCVIGRGNSLTSCTLSSSGWIPLLLMWCPKNVNSLTPSMHFSGFMITPYLWRCWKTEHKCCLCWSALRLDWQRWHRQCRHM